MQATQLPRKMMMEGMRLRFVLVLLGAHHYTRW